MSPRAIRRAAEHKARKLAARQARAFGASNPEPQCMSVSEPEASAPLAISRDPKIPKRSTGPRTAEGKAISSMNALKTGLTGRTVLLPSEDAAAYETHIEQYRAEYAPVGIRETELVQSLADTSWRLRRIPGLEMALYALGRCEFAASFDAHDPSLRDSMIELQTFLKYEKHLRNLHLQESRLRRRYTAEAKELRNLQGQRKERRKATGGDYPHVDSPRTAIPATDAPAPREFEFSTAVGDDASEPALAPLADAAPLSRLHNSPGEFQFSPAGV